MHPIFFLLFFYIAFILTDRTLPDQKTIFYSIPYINSECADLNHNKWMLNSDLVQIYTSTDDKLPDKSDSSAEFRAVWSSRGLTIYCQVNDDVFCVDTLAPWKSDALEIFVAPYRGSTDIIQLTVLPCNSPDPARSFTITKNYRTTPSVRKIPVKSFSCSKRSGTKTFYKVFIQLDALNITPGLNTKLAMQIYVNDADQKDGSLKNQLIWYPAGHSYENSFSMFDIIFTGKELSFPKEISKCYIKDNDSVIITIYSNTFNKKDIKIKCNERIIASAEKIYALPFTLSFSLDKINTDRDTIQVFCNENLIFIHELINVARIFEKIKPPGAFERQIRFFEACDQLSFPPENAILFIGSSSIRRWYSLKEYFPDQEIIHRGFGGSNASDALSYIDRIVLPYKPLKIVYYEGDNDIPQDYPIEKIIADIESFIEIVHKNLPGTEIYMITPKPSFARIHLWTKYVDLIKEIVLLSEKYDFVSYIDIVTPMFDNNDLLRKDIFDADNLHLNERGYEIWGQTIRDKILL